MSGCVVCGGGRRLRKWHPYQCKPYEDRPCPSCRPNPSTTCEGYGGVRHRSTEMTLVGLEDDGTHVWRCPRCMYVWREDPETVALSRFLSSQEGSREENA